MCGGVLFKLKEANTSEYNAWSLSGSQLEQTSYKIHSGENWGNLNMDLVLDDYQGIISNSINVTMVLQENICIPQRCKHIFMNEMSWQL